MIRSALPLALAITGMLAPVPVQSQTDTFTEEVDVTEVLLDVLVTDAKGNVIIGLNQDDFIVAEAGRSVDVTSVAFYSNRLALDEEARPAEVPADRFFILFFDDQRQVDGDGGTTLLRRQLDAGRQTKQWIREEMLGGDWVAVVSFDSKLEIHHDFSQDRANLVQAVDDAVRGAKPTNIWPSRRPESTTEHPTLLAHLPEGKALRQSTKKIHDALRVLADATAGIQGRKSVLLFTVGFGEVQQFSGNTKPDLVYYPPMQQALNDHNVAVYPIDLTPTDGEGFQTSFLTLLANDTGGAFYDNVNNYLAPLQTIADENNGYYLLSYRAEHPRGQTGYQEVDIQTRNRGFQVRARRGYRFGT